MSIQDTEQVIMNITMDMAEDPEGVYNDVMELIREEAIEKEIEYDGYYRIKWEEEAENVMTFDKDYFENKDRRDLYIFKSALDDKEIFHLLHYIWNLAKGEDLNENILHREIYTLQEKGVKF
ncbi:hypothetical protein [Chryseobacterium carnipullorum]|uniref:hypothetical protein n=1 Tax=Chryseobacterium carnipullorum TaxID=1124835 RepID=UPI0009327E9D|nr:hypothetical protein [Chryseobacterium carnipullorum]